MLKDEREQGGGVQAGDARPAAASGAPPAAELDTVAPSLDTALSIEPSLTPPDDPQAPPAQPTPPWPQGAPRLGRYTLEGELGRGGMGVVYRATDTALNREVALKLQSSGVDLDGVHTRRLQREARAVASLDHPNIVKVFDTGEEGGRIYFVMQLIRGPSLARRLQQGPLPVDQAVAVALALARALAYAHAQGLVHRDVKPGNVLLENGRAYLTDFGLVKALREDATALTLHAGVLGTPAYMAPEQTQGDRGEVGPAADQYGLGVLLYEMLSGRRPHSSAHTAELLESIRELDPPSLRAEGIPPELDWIVAKTLRKLPEDRYESCDALARDLERFQAGEPVSVTAPSLRQQLRSRARRHRRTLFVLVISALAAALALGAAGAWLRYQAGEQRRRQERVAEQRRQALDSRMEALRTEGKADEAQDAFTAFVEIPEHQGTLALSRAWMDQARRQGEGGDSEAQLSSLARGYLAAPTHEARGEILLVLAHLFQEQGAWPRLTTVLDTLQRETPGLMALPEVRQLTAQSRLAHRDLSAARAGLGGLPGSALGSVAEAFSASTRTGHRLEGGHVMRLPSTADHPGELLLLPVAEGPARAITLKGPALTEVATLPLERDGEIHIARSIAPSEGQPAQLLTWGGARRHITLHSRDAAGFHPIHSWADDPPGAVLTADVDGDGADEVFVGTQAYSRHLLALSPTGPDGAWVQRWPYVPSSWVGSDIMAGFSRDLDGDGADELVLAFGPWKSYDVKVLDQRGEPRLSIAARVKLGMVTELDLLPGEPDRIVAIKKDLYPNPRVFPPDRPYGEPAGLYLLRLSGDRLEIDARLPVPDDASLARPCVGDFNGDGLADLALWNGHTDPAYTLLYAQAPDGSFQRGMMLDLLPLTAADLDGDGDDELVVSDQLDDGQLWVLGAGSEALSVREEARHQVNVPRSNEPGIVEKWALAEDLAAIGLVDEAIAQLQLIAGIAVDPESAASALDEAADLLRAADHPLEAARRQEEAARRGGPLAAQRWEAAVDGLQAANRPADALAAAGRLLDLSDLSPQERTRWEARRAGLEDELRPDRSWRTDFSAPLDPQWRFTEATALRWEPSTSSLGFDRVEHADHSPVASLPLEWPGGRLSLEADIALERLEWSAGIAISLYQEGGEGPVGVGVDAQGGQSQLFHLPGCRVGGWMDGLSTAVTQPATPSRHRLRLDLLSEDLIRCSVSTPDGVEVWATQAKIPHGLKPGRLILGISGRPADWAGYVRARGQVHSIAVQGARPGRWEDEEPPRSALYRSMIQGATGQVIAALEEGTVADPILLYDALRSQGRDEEASRVLATTLRAGALDDPTLGPELIRLLRLYPEKLTPLIRDTLGWQPWLTAFVNAWDTVSVVHASDDLVYSVLALSLEVPRGLELSREQVVSVASLLSARAEGALVVGKVGAARSDLELGLALLERAASPDESPTDQVLRTQIVSTLQMHLGEVCLRGGDLEGAARWTLAALRSTPSPEVRADILVATAAFKPLHSHPIWERYVLPAHRTGRVPDSPEGATP